MVFNTAIATTDAEKTAIDGLKAAIASLDVPKQKVGPPLDHELTLLRFVRGYNLDVKDATKAFSEMLQYRAANGIDEKREAMYAAATKGDELAWPVTGLAKFAPLVACTGAGLMHQLGKTSNGMPATFVPLHLYDVKAVLRQNLGPLLIELQQHQDEWWAVTLLQSSLAAGAMHAVVQVVGAHELGLFHFGISEARMLMKVLEGSKHYPESSGKIISVGNGKALLAMYNAVIKPFMPQHTKEKILVLGRDIETDKNKDALGLDEAAYAKLLEMTGRTRVAAAAPAVDEAVPVS